jgi:hypothetical protein
MFCIAAEFDGSKLYISSLVLLAGVPVVSTLPLVPPVNVFIVVLPVVIDPAAGLVQLPNVGTQFCNVAVKPDTVEL